ncbi:MAG: hypothetical protein AAGA32_11710 [Pseudomonadota bacterium]
MDALLFAGRLGRGGFLLNLAFAILIVVLAFEHYLPGLPPEDLIQISLDDWPRELAYAGIGAVWLVLSSIVRRLRDVGSPVPGLEFAFGLLLPFAGQAWLFYRLFLAGSRRERVPEVKPEPASPRPPAKEPKPRTGPWGGAPEASPAATKPAPEPPQPAVLGRGNAPTVRRRGRSAGGGRRIGF